LLAAAQKTGNEHWVFPVSHDVSTHDFAHAPLHSSSTGDNPNPQRKAWKLFSTICLPRVLGGNVRLSFH
jgi:hypothetical protein